MGLFNYADQYRIRADNGFWTQNRGNRRSSKIDIYYFAADAQRRLSMCLYMT